LVDGSSVAGEKNVHWRYFTEQGWFSAAFGPFRRFVENESTKNYISTRLQAHHSLFKEDAPLQDALLWLIQLQFKSLEKDKNATFLLQKLILFINQSELLPQGVRLTKISSEGVFLKDAINKALEINQLSDGFRAVLSLVFELLRHLVGVFGAKRVFQNMTNDNLMIDLSGVVLIDEVDVHLHPSWQTRIGDWFLKCFPKMQFIVTTHSPLICRACERGSIWRLPNQPNEKLVEIKGIDKQKLIYGNVLDAYGTEVFGQAVVRSAKSDEKLSRLGRLDMLSAFGKITPEQETERIELQKIFSTDGIFDK
jgi:AAA domain, putative AbiEii toxin, Type IV TA system